MQSSPKLPDQNKALTLLGQFIGDIQQAMPETIKKNVLKAGNQLIFGMADIPIAWLEQFSKRIRRKTEAMDMIQRGENAAIVKLFEQDPTLAQETLNFNSLKEYKAFFNRQKVMQGAMEELKNNPPDDTDKEIDEDWLEMFSRATETKSSDEVQLIFSKILSGEIRKPGSFSPKTLQALTILDRDTAKHFIKYCSIAYSSTTSKHQNIIIVADGPYRHFWNKNMPPKTPKPFFEDKTAKESLQELGLLSYNESELISFEHSELLTPHFIGSIMQYYTKVKDERIRGKIEFRILKFTSVGLQLKSVINPPANQEYVNLFNERFKRSEQILLKS